jgi:hypothetical protein
MPIVNSTNAESSEPNRAAMLEMLQHLFGDLGDGLIELAWTARMPDGSSKLSKAQLYRLDQLNDLVNEAIKENAQGNNVYVGAQLRHNDTPPFGRAKDADAIGMTSAYIDLDDPGVAQMARSTWGFLVPTFLVITGRTPDVRMQVWWRLDKLSTDQARNAHLLKAMAVAFHGDATVTNPGRVMRLCGSIAHPKKPGRVLELTEQYRFRVPGKAAYTIEELEAAFLPAVLELKVTPKNAATAIAPPAQISHKFYQPGKLEDGREKYMRDTVLACLIQFGGQNGAWPTEAELFDLVWPQYQRNVDLTRPGRGEAEVREKCAIAIRRAEAGEIQGLETLDKIVEAWRNRSKPVICVVAGKMHRVLDEAEAAIIASGLDYYQRGSLIVRPTACSIATAHGDILVSQRLEPVKAHHLAELITRVASLQRYDGKAGGWVPIDRRLNIAETYLARSGDWRLPVLSGLINTPTLRADGSVLDKCGYDAMTGLLFEPQGIIFSAVPEDPTKEDALAALEVLLTAIETFPFVGEADRAVAMSAILTTIIRRTMLTAPLHAFNAPVAGSGKSLLVDIASMIATGRRAAVIAQGKTEEEMEKRLGAALIAGDQLISIDNCEAPLGGELLCQALTQQMLKVRILGKSKNAEVPTNAAMFATGNNLMLTGDVIRRAVRCSLDAGVERPELREFDFDPVAEAAAKRHVYVLAALTILRAFSVAGRPRKSIPLGSFTEWSSWVRDSLIWLGMADACETMEQVRNSDPQQEALVSVVEQWSLMIGDRIVSVKDVIDAAIEPKSLTVYSPRTEFLRPDFREALLTVAGEHGAINSRRLGKWLSAKQNRVVGKMKFISMGTVSGVMRWRLVSCESKSTDPINETRH